MGAVFAMTALEGTIGSAVRRHINDIYNKYNKQKYKSYYDKQKKLKAITMKESEEIQEAVMESDVWRVKMAAEAQKIGNKMPNGPLIGKDKKAKIPIADAAHHAIHLQKMKKDKTGAPKKKKKKKKKK